MYCYGRLLLLSSRLVTWIKHACSCVVCQDAKSICAVTVPEYDIAQQLHCTASSCCALASKDWPGYIFRPDHFTINSLVLIPSGTAHLLWGIAWSKPGLVEGLLPGCGLYFLGGRDLAFDSGLPSERERERERHNIKSTGRAWACASHFQCPR